MRALIFPVTIPKDVLSHAEGSKIQSCFTESSCPRAPAAARCHLGKTWRIENETADLRHPRSTIIYGGQFGLCCQIRDFSSRRSKIGSAITLKAPARAVAIDEKAFSSSSDLKVEEVSLWRAVMIGLRKRQAVNFRAALRRRSRIAYFRLPDQRIDGSFDMTHHGSV